MLDFSRKFMFWFIVDALSYPHTTTCMDERHQKLEILQQNQHCDNTNSFKIISIRTFE